MCVCVFIYVFGVDVYVCMFETSLGFTNPNKEEEKKICEVSFFVCQGKRVCTCAQQRTTYVS